MHRRVTQILFILQCKLGHHHHRAVVVSVATRFPATTSSVKVSDRVSDIESAPSISPTIHRLTFVPRRHIHHLLM